MEKEYMNKKEMAKYLGLNTRTVDKILEDNADIIIYQKIGRKFIINKQSVDDAIAKKLLK